MAGALLEIVQGGLISKHDTLDLILPLTLALMCQPASDEVRLMPLQLSTAFFFQVVPCHPAELTVRFISCSAVARHPM